LAAGSTGIVNEHDSALRGRHLGGIKVQSSSYRFLVTSFTPPYKNWLKHIEANGTTFGVCHSLEIPPLPRYVLTSLCSLPQGLYNWVIFPNKTMVAVKFNNALEWGTKHYHLAMNNAITASGELRVSYQNITWNLYSGTFDDLLVSIGVPDDPTAILVYKQTVVVPQLKPYFLGLIKFCPSVHLLIGTSVGDFTLFPKQPTIAEMKELCLDPGFQALLPCTLDFEGKLVKGLQVSRLHYYVDNHINCFGESFCMMQK